MRERVSIRGGREGVIWESGEAGSGGCGDRLRWEARPSLDVSFAGVLQPQGRAQRSHKAHSGSVCRP